MNTLQKDIIASLNVQPSIIPLEEIERRTSFLATQLATTGLSGYVLGISGGQDSLLAGILAQRAVNRRRAAGFDATFHAVLLPYGKQADRSDAELALDVIRPDIVHDINIQSSVNAMVTALETSNGYPVRDFDKGNIKARARMAIQYALASEHGALVIGTDHAAEAVTGFFTKYGDGGADVTPLAGLTKRQGRAMLEALGVPTIFTTKAPTADLLDTTPGQADEQELGISYTDIDDYLEGRPISPDVARKIDQRYLATAHKRALPVAP